MSYCLSPMRIILKSSSPSSFFHLAIQLTGNLPYCLLRLMSWLCPPFPLISSPCAWPIIFLLSSSRIPAHPLGFCFSPASSVKPSYVLPGRHRHAFLDFPCNTTWLLQFWEYKCIKEINRLLSTSAKHLSSHVLRQFLKSSGLRISLRCHWSLPCFCLSPIWHLSSVFSCVGLSLTAVEPEKVFLIVYQD